MVDEHHKALKDSIWKDGLNYKAAKDLAASVGINLSMTSYHTIYDAQHNELGRKAISLLIQLNEATGPGSTEDYLKDVVSQISKLVQDMPKHIINNHME